MSNPGETAEMGQFWRQDDEDRKLWGTLKTKDTNEITLETCGSLMGIGERSMINIVGRIKGGQELVTLIKCFPFSTLNSFIGPDEEDAWPIQICLVNYMVKGIAFTEGEDIAFAEAILDISTMPKWVTPNLVELEMTKGSAGKYRMDVSVKDRDDEVAILKFRDEEIRISIRFKPKGESRFSGVISKYSVEDHCLLAIDKPDGTKVSLETILSITGIIMNLLSICCNETPAINRFMAHLEKGEISSADVFVRMRGHNVEKKEGYPYPALSFKDIGGVEGIAKWLEVTETYGPPVGLLTSNWFSDRGYNEDKLARVYTAVEGLLSRKKERTKARMSIEELAEFAEEMVPDFSSITDSAAEHWAKKVREIRDQTISHSDPVSTVTVDGRDIVKMTNILYLVGASFMLRETGMEEHRIEKYVQGCYQTLWFNDRR